MIILLFSIYCATLRRIYIHSYKLQSYLHYVRTIHAWKPLLTQCVCIYVCTLYMSKNMHGRSQGVDKAASRVSLKYTILCHFIDLFCNKKNIYIYFIQKILHKTSRNLLQKPCCPFLVDRLATSLYKCKCVKVCMVVRTGVQACEYANH